MLAAVKSGAMPPGGIDRSGACGDFRGPKPFSDDDVRVLRSWMGAGMPAGASLPAPALAVQPRFDRRVDVALPLVDARDAHDVNDVNVANDVTGDGDVHRCHLVHVGQAGALVGVSVVGGAAVHHAMIFALPSDALAATRALDARDAAAGWDCPTTPGIAGAALAFAWVPGSDTVAFPAGTGVPIGDDVVVQVHQHGAAAGDVALSLLVADEVAAPVAVVPMALAGFSLPPGNADVEITRTMPFHGRVIGVMPHLHELGRGARIDVDNAAAGDSNDGAGGGCLVDADRYDFRFQEVAFYDEPIDVATSRLALRCRWDTTSRVAATPWGEASNDEMCTVFLFTTP